MGWVFGRVLWVLATLAFGALGGAALGGLVDQGGLGAWLGAGGLVSVWVGIEGLRAQRLMHWLQDARVRQAPRDGGLWSELAYRFERALRDRDQRIVRETQRLADFLSAIEASPNGIVLLDDGVHIGWCNQAAGLHLGLDPARDRGQQLTNLVRVPAFVRHLQDHDWREPVTFARPGGSGELQALLRAYGEGQVLMVTQDVTERLRAEAMRRDFVANVSHEIRTPLTVLAGFVESMRNLPLNREELDRVLTLMQQQAGRMQVLVGDLLTLAQLEGSPRPGSDVWLPVQRLLQRVCAEAESLSKGRHTVRLLNGPALEVAGLESELMSAVGNLASNAVRYTPEGGHIDLRWARRGDGRLEIEVRDDGPGIAREHIPRLTERFYRVDSSRSRETGGTGLGLAIVKHVAQRHGGELEIDSAPRQGSRFRLVLPPVRVREVGAASAAVATVAAAVSVEPVALSSPAGSGTPP